MKESNLEFYVNKFNYLNDIDGLDLSFIPPIVRRRMSVLDKITLSNLNSVYSDNTENIVFSSQYGEVTKLLKIIDQYMTEKEVSPNTFSGSVHNYAISSFLLNKQKSIPYTALSACGQTFSMGLLSSVISNYNNVLYCYSDDNKGIINSFAINLSKTKEQDANKYVLIPQNNAVVNDEFINYQKLLNSEIDAIKTPTYTLMRL